MPTGLATSWGCGPRLRGSLSKYLLQQNLYSDNPYFLNKNYVSPLFKESKRYVLPTQFSFGKTMKRKKTKKRVLYKKKKKMYISKKKCKEFMNSGRTINPFTYRKIKPHGTIYNMLMSKCKEPSTERYLELEAGDKTPRNVPSLFVGRRPPIPTLPLEQTIPTFQPVRAIPVIQRTKKIVPTEIITNFNGNEYKITPRESISFLGKRFIIGDRANIGNNTQGTITKIGSKQIILNRDESRKERRIEHFQFFELNN